jgi:hypothetical protein
MSAVKSPRPVVHRGRPLSSYVDPFPGLSAKDRVKSLCGYCDGSGIYHGHSSWIWYKGKRAEKWCFQCGGQGHRMVSVASQRRRAKEDAYQRDYADEINAERAAAWAEVAAAQHAEDWDAAHAEQARRAALVSGFAGDIGQRVRNLPGVVKVAKSYDASYGFHSAIGMFLIIALDSGQVLKVSGVGSSLFGHEPGDRVKVSGSVKAHENYNGQDQSVLIRAKVESEGSK